MNITYRIKEDYKKYKENIKLRTMYLKDSEKYASIASFGISAKKATNKMLEYYDIIGKLSHKISNFEKILYYHFDTDEIIVLDFFLNHTVQECADEWGISYRSVFRKITVLNKKYLGVKNGTNQ